MLPEGSENADRKSTFLCQLHLGPGRQGLAERLGQSPMTPPPRRSSRRIALERLELHEVAAVPPLTVSTSTQSFHFEKTPATLAAFSAPPSPDTTKRRVAT